MFNAEPWAEAWTVASAHAYLSDHWHTPRASGVVAPLEGNLTGFVLGHAEQRDIGKHFYLTEMCVRSEHQGRGIGRRLLEVLEAELKAQGVGKIYLLTARAGSA